MDRKEGTTDLKGLLEQVSKKALDVQRLKEVKKKHRDNTVYAICRMLNIENIYYSTAPRVERRKVQKVASSLLKVNKLRRRMWYIIQIARELTSKKITTVEELFDEYETEKKENFIIVKLRKAENSHEKDYIYIKVVMRQSSGGATALYIPERMPMTTSVKGNMINSNEMIEELLNFVLQEFDEFERIFVEKIEKWLSK
jgi:hypothetical protein|nr:MAG TPA: hypothetical protein [Crassvirales sp.]